MSDVLLKDSGKYTLSLSVQFSSVTQSYPTLYDPMSCSTPGLPVHTISRSSLKLTSIESAMTSDHLILCCPLLLLPSVFPSIRVFSSESVLKKPSTDWHTWEKNENMITEINARRKTIQSLRENRISISERSIIKVQSHVKRKNCFFQSD